MLSKQELLAKIQQEEAYLKSRMPQEDAPTGAMSKGMAVLGGSVLGIVTLS